MIFIVLDGIDGTGKTTQAMLLKNYLEKKGKKVFYTKEYSDGEYGKIIKNLIRKRGASSISHEKWIELFTLDRNEHLKEIKEALKDKIVICDRYYYSTLAYQLDEREWQDYVAQFLKPTIAFILDLDPEAAMKRINDKSKKTHQKKTYFEKINMIAKARKKFLLLPTYLKDNIKIISANRSIEEILDDIKKEINILLKTN